MDEFEEDDDKAESGCGETGVADGLSVFLEASIDCIAAEGARSRAALDCRTPSAASELGFCGKFIAFELVPGPDDLNKGESTSWLEERDKADDGPEEGHDQDEDDVAAHAAWLATPGTDHHENEEDKSDNGDNNCEIENKIGERLDFLLLDEVR